MLGLEAAYIFYGPGWLPEIIISLDTAKSLLPPTPWWETLSNANVKNIIPFCSDDVFFDSNHIHYLEHHLKVEFKMTPGRKRIDPREWLDRFTGIQDMLGSVRDSLNKLALTPISVFVTHDWFHDEAHTQLLLTLVTSIWIGTYLFAGSPWLSTNEEMVDVSSPPAQPKASAKPFPILTCNVKPKSTPKSYAEVINLTSREVQGVSFSAKVK